MARQVGLPQLIQKMTEMNTRIKECERNKGYVTMDDVNSSITSKLEAVTSQKNNYATNDDLEDKFQKYLQSEQNLSKQTVENVASLKTQLEEYKGQVASFKTLTTQMLETIDTLRSEVNSSKAHHDALVLRVNELQEKKDEPSE